MFCKATTFPRSASLCVTCAQAHEPKLVKGFEQTVQLHYALLIYSVAHCLVVNNNLNDLSIILMFQPLIAKRIGVLRKWHQSLGSIHLMVFDASKVLLDHHEVCPPHRHAVTHNPPEKTFL